MSPSRRLLQFSPLAVLTLFFAALGWRNWHLSMGDDEVFAAVAADYRGPKQRPTDVINRVTWRVSAPFADDEVTVVRKKNDETWQPISAKLMARLKRDYPNAHLANTFPPHSSPECSFSFEQAQIVNRFQARCIVYYTLKAPDNPAKAEFKETFLLKRSPVNFLDSDWHVEESSSNLIAESSKWTIPDYPSDYGVP